MNYKDIPRGNIPEKWRDENGFTIAYTKLIIETTGKPAYRYLALPPGYEEHHLKNLDPTLKNVLIIYENISKDADKKLNEIKTILESGKKLNLKNALFE